jgi:hypothetical protein
MECSVATVATVVTEVAHHQGKDNETPAKNCAHQVGLPEKVESCHVLKYRRRSKLCSKILYSITVNSDTPKRYLVNSKNPPNTKEKTNQEGASQMKKMGSD